MAEKKKGNGSIQSSAQAAQQQRERQRPAQVAPAPVAAAAASAGNNQRLIGRWEWAAFAIATLASFGVYYYSLAPTVTLEDSGELAVGGDFLGVPHPPGYPLWSILAYIFARVFSFMKYYGQPNPAWAIALLSAVAGALSAGVTAMLICRSGRDMLTGIRRKNSEMEESHIDRVISFGGAVMGSLFFAFSPVMWSQSNIVEVYSLNAFCISLVMLFAYLWLKSQSDAMLYAAALSLGLGVANWWPSAVLAIVPLVLIVYLKNLRLCRDFAPAGIVIVGMIALNMVFLKLMEKTDAHGGIVNQWVQGYLWTNGPYSVIFWVYAAINFLAIGLSWILLPRGRTVALTFLIFELGVLVYLYMPLVSDLRNPPMNWGYPRTWEGFMHAVGRGQYEKLTPTEIFSKTFIDQVGGYMTELRAQFFLPVVLVGFLPFVAWNVRAGKYRASALLVAIGLIAVATVLVFIEEFGRRSLAIPLGDHPLRIYMILALFILLMLVIGFAGLVLREIGELMRKLYDPEATGTWEKLLILAAFFVGIVLVVYYEWHLMTLLIQVDQNTKKSILSATSKLAVAGLMLAPLALAGIVSWLMFGQSGGLAMDIDVDEDSQKWILAVLAGFLLMSVGMIVGANPRGDVQDMFIQRVKYITSHELFAFWIGYGAILGMAVISRKLRDSRPVAYVMAFGAVAITAVPVLLNAPYVESVANKDFLRIYGGTDQRKHDFGWQFGNYQLQGAIAITNELAPGEEPPPNPNYPPPMEPDAIFYGGTDPGRFVPTYMIYSARVREDVYLITQNALADGTYMSVMRDLYGDRIWIPSTADSNDAFKQYHEEVRAGLRPGNVDFKGGRVIVQGVDQVMAINGILCKQIHDHNKWRHPFYVEESYIIPWMYPYMEPHGLILKINPEPLPGLTPEQVKNDMEFWAWYSRRLLNNKRFIYDSVARKSFSKLRSAIAGLYESRQMWENAEKAYRESVELCPLSPEAAFRLAQMYMRLGRLDDALELLKWYQKEDPNNGRTREMIGIVQTRKDKIAQKTALEQYFAVEGPKEQVEALKKAIELAFLYREFGDTQRLIQLTRNILETPSLPPDVYLGISRMYAEMRNYDEMDRALKLFKERNPTNMPAQFHRMIADTYAHAATVPPQTQEAVVRNLTAACEEMRKYLALTPRDYTAWHELGVMNVFLGKEADAIRSLKQALVVGGEQAMSSMKQDGRIPPSLLSQLQYTPQRRPPGPLDLSL